jgi:hypothetical protein
MIDDKEAWMREIRNMFRIVLTYFLNVIKKFKSYLILNFLRS